MLLMINWVIGLFNKFNKDYIYLLYMKKKMNF